MRFLPTFRPSSHTKSFRVGPLSSEEECYRSLDSCAPFGVRFVYLLYTSSNP